MGMGSCRKLETPGSDPGTQLGMWAIGPWHNNGNVGHLEQRQIVGGIPQGQDLHLLGTQMTLQGGQGLAFADAWAQQSATIAGVEPRLSELTTRELASAASGKTGHHTAEPDVMGGTAGWMGEAE